jgi:Domain of unknown function (DUF4926)
MKPIPQLAHVALVVDLPENGLTRGQIGTVVEKLGTEERGALLVEFSSEDGQAYAFAELRPEQVMVLHRQEGPRGWTPNPSARLNL